MSQLGALAIALLSAAVFIAAGLMAVAGTRPATTLRPYAAPIAAGVLLALAFGDVFPEAIELATNPAIIAFAAAFTLIYLLETRVHAAEHDDPDTSVHTDLGALIVGLAAHNAADGFALGATEHLSGASTGLIGLGILIHQLPIGLSFAGILLAHGSDRREIVRWALSVALVIPMTTAITVVLPVATDQALGAMMGASAGLLVYIGAAHLLPEVRAQRHSGRLGIVFAVTLAIMTIASLAIGG